MTKNKIAILIFVFSVAGLMGQSSDQNEWIRYTAEEGRFTIMLPSEPEVLEKEILTSIGEMTLYSYMMAPDYSDRDPNLMYLVEYYDYPEGTFPIDSVDLRQLFYDHTASATSLEIGGELTYQTQSTVGGIDGVLYRCVYKDGTFVMKSRMFFVGDRFYHLKVYCPHESALNDEKDWFLNSFQYIE